MNELFSIEDKVAVITGAGGVLGGSIARSFVGAGAKVAAVDIRRENLDTCVAELNARGSDRHCRKCVGHSESGKRSPGNHRKMGTY